MSSEAGLTAVILLSIQYLLLGILLLSAAIFFAFIVFVVLSTSRIAWRTIFLDTVEAPPPTFDVLAAGDHVTVRLGRRRRRVGVNGGVLGHVGIFLTAVARACRYYYDD